MLKHSSSPGTTAPPQAGCAVLSPPGARELQKEFVTRVLVVFSFFFLVFLIWW